MKNGSPPCQPCKDAKAAHSRASAEKKRNDEPRRKAWWKACSRLAERHPAEFREILLEELDRVGYVPPPDEGEHS
jgi:transposase